MQLNGANAELDATRNRLEAAQAQNEQLTTDLSATTEQLDGKIAENETLTANLQATTERLTAKTAENETLTADLNATTEQLTTKIAENETLTANLEATTERLTVKTAENETLTADLNATTERLTTKTVENETLTTNLNATTERLTAKTAENETLTANLETTTEQLAAKSAEHAALVQEVGMLESVKGQIVTLNARVESLNSQIGRLNSEIAELERRRRPLIVDSYTSGFKCTGSMEPKITCLDMATWLENFKPEDIVVGTVISFTPTAECNLTSSRVAHRVVSTRQSGSFYYYWPKGDANSSDDGCWIPDTNVNGYIIEMQKNVRPENIGLRNRVNTAKANRNQARSNYEYASAVHDQKQDRYDSLRLRYCGSLTGSCTLPTDQYNELTALLDQLISGYEDLLRLLEVYRAARAVWEQAYYEARTS